MQTNKIKQEKTGENVLKVYLSGLDDWDQDLQREAKDLLAEFGHLFTLDDLNQWKDLCN